jgi:hypothetical protein
MPLLKYLLVAVCLVALLGSGAAADDKPDAKEKELKGAALVADRIWWGKEFELTLTAPDTGEKFQRARAGVVWDHLVFSNCFALDGKGGLSAVVKFTRTGDTFTLRSIGPAEDIYAIRTYQLEKTFPKHLKKVVDAVKDTPDVKVGSVDLPKTAKEIDPIPSYLLPVCAAAAVKYEEKRPELMLRVKKEHSHLFFPQAGRSSWYLQRDGDRLFVTAGCSDKMFYARFQVEFKKKAGGGDGEWEYVRIHGMEEWKGE